MVLEPPHRDARIITAMATRAQKPDEDSAASGVRNLPEQVMASARRLLAELEEKALP